MITFLTLFVVYLQTWHGLGSVVTTPYVLASFSTELASWEIARNTNVSLAARKTDGTYLLPGAEFSMNRLLGSRTAKEGYRSAPTFTPLGKLDSLAGGICQVSSTIYNAALLANLRITERHPHSLTVRYLIAGRDATISEYADLRFVNTRPGPIRISVAIKGRQLKCTIYGAEPASEQVDIFVESRMLPNGLLATRTYREVRIGDRSSREMVSEDVYIPSS